MDSGRNDPVLQPTGGGNWLVLAPQVTGDTANPGVALTMADELGNDELAQLLAGSSGQAIVDPNYSIRLEERAGCLFLVVSGRVLQPIPDEFCNRFAQLMDGRAPPRAIIDLRQCLYLSSSVFGTLMEFFKAATDHQGQVLVLGPNQRIRAMLRVIGLDVFMLEVETEEMAIHYFHEQAKLPRTGLAQDPPAAKL